MGGKKKRVLAQTGSLISPIFRYMVEANFQVNMADKKGAKLSEELYRVAYKTPKSHVQPNFTTSYKFQTNQPISYLEAKYLNGWEERLYLHNTTYNEIKYIIQRNNKVIEGVRNFQGYDDELDDEESEL